MKQLPKNYDPKEAEPRWQKYWEENNIYSFDPNNTEKEIFSIDTPPPTVSGKMHMGHAFGNSQQDFVARFKRMNGFNVLQPFGTDDNGLPTKLLIEKEKKVKASMMDRKEFRKLCLDTLEKELKPKYTQDWKRLGISCDFDVTYSTIDPHSQKISQKSFLDLHKKGRQYRKEAPAMYCPKCQTAISQVECEDANVSSFFNDIVFKVKNDGKEEELIIATTRPELLPACVAVFYHPDDKRYQHLKDKKAVVPLFDFEVPILEDERADPEKGTGIVMCCTFGDSTDVEWQKAHNLPIKEAINKEGKMTSLAKKYQGMSIETARKLMIEDMKDQRLLLSQEPITHAVNVHERCGTQIEFIHSKQWFVKYLDLKDDMLKWGNDLNWFPKHMKNRYDNWVKGLAWDWLISRQLPFGIPFPVWYCKDCEEVILAKEKDLPVDPVEDKPPVDKCPECDSKNIVPEQDIINTWATSSLTPTIVIELFKDKPVYNKLKDNPMNLRPQGHDIISFWLFNTVIKSKLHYDMKPWNDCFINGWMLDPKGKKMSKSKGNIIEPQAMIEKYSADALRFMAGGVKLGEDLPFPEKDLLTGQKFITKFWNASKFAIMHLQDFKGLEMSRKSRNDSSIHLEDYKLKEPAKLEAFDKWLLSKLNNIIKSSTDSFEIYEFSRCKADTEKFFWHTLCDNYLEIVKDRLYNPDKRGEESRTSAQYALYTGLLTCLKLMAPFTPHFTEEIYHLYFSKKENKKSIHISDWPEFNKELTDKNTEHAGDTLIEIIAAVRKFKAENKLSMKEELKSLVIESKDSKDFGPFLDDLKAVTHAKDILFEGKTDIVISEEVKVGIEI
ncbi:valine--tRNA ligase [Candidatus Woesearchaeota archaeon]|nr:valine--tRNA ligase [Candidatus Woesearchaeota archaeon]